MLIRYTDLVTLNLVASDGSKHPVRDVLVEERELAVTHVVADLGGWFSDRTGVIGIGRFGQPDIASTTWPCTLDEAALQERAGSEPAGKPGSGDALLAPPGTEAGPHLLEAPQAGPRGAIRSVRDWVSGATVDASDGHLGTLMGVIFDSGDWRARYVIVGTGENGIQTHQRVFEIGQVDGTGFDGGAIRLSVSRAEAEKALDLHELDDVEGKWYNKVMAYYGLR